MEIPKHLKARLAQLEARVASLPDPKAEREWKRLVSVHYTTWLDEGSFEDISEEDRDRELWGRACYYGPILLAVIWSGGQPGREALLASGVDFTRAAGIDEDDVRAYLNRTSDPNTPHKPRGSLSLYKARRGKASLGDSRSTTARRSRSSSL